MDAKKIIKYLKGFKELKNTNINIDYLDFTTGSCSIQSPEKKETIKEFVDGEKINRYECELFRLIPFDSIETQEIGEFYNNLKNWIYTNDKKGIYPEINNIIKIQILNNYFIVEENNTEAIYSIKIALDIIERS